MLVQGPMIMQMIMLSQTINRKISTTILIMIAANINDSLSISYGEREVEHIKASAAHVTEQQDGMAIAYTMGSAKLAVQKNEVTNNGGTAGASDESLEVALSLSF